MTIAGVPVIGFDTWRTRFHHVPCVVCVGESAARRHIADRIAAAGGHTVSLYRVQGAISPDVSVDEGSLIAYPVFIGAATRIGRYVQVMPLASIGHDCALGDFVTVSPSAVISGHVIVEEESFVGANATIVNGTAERPLRIGRGVRIHAGAVVTRSVADGCRVAGNPAREMRDLAMQRRRERGLPAPPAAPSGGAASDRG